jgi:hypothetical protein
MIDSHGPKEQTSYSLRSYDIRKAAAAYEFMRSAAEQTQMLSIPALEALRNYLKEETKDMKRPLTLCDRVFVECINELIAGVRLQERRLFEGITGIVPPTDEGSS